MSSEEEKKNERKIIYCHECSLASRIVEKSDFGDFIRTQLYFCPRTSQVTVSMDFCYKDELEN